VQVQFFAETNLIGTVTNQPFNLLWPVIVPGLSFGKFNLKAVAVDNLGARTESRPISVGYHTGAPPAPILEIVSRAQCGCLCGSGYVCLRRGGSGKHRRYRAGRVSCRDQFRWTCGSGDRIECHDSAQFADRKQP